LFHPFLNLCKLTASAEPYIKASHSSAGQRYRRSARSKTKHTVTLWLGKKMTERECDTGLQKETVNWLLWKITEKGGLGTRLKIPKQINKRWIQVKSSQQCLALCNHPRRQQMLFSGAFPGNMSWYLH